MARLAGRGAEAVDEGLHVGLLGLHLAARGGLEPGLLRALLLKAREAAGVVVEPALGEVQDGVHRVVEQFAVVADDQGAVRIFAQARLQPQRAFEIEIVGRLVEQQQVRLGEQGRGHGDAHPPAAGELRHRPGEVCGGEAEAAEDFGGAGRGAVGVDVVEPGVDVAEAFGRRGLQLGHQRSAFEIGGEHGLQQRDRRRGVLLLHRGDPRGLGPVDLAASGAVLAEDKLEQGRLAGAVAADQPDLGPDRQADRGVIEEPPAPGVEHEIMDTEHGCGAGLERGRRRGRLGERRAALYRLRPPKFPPSSEPIAMSERTFSILKPDATKRNLTGKINAVIEEAGLRIVAQRRIRMTQEEAEDFYDVHRERPFYGELVEFMTSEPVVVQVLEADNAVARYREVMGATNPENADAGTIRKLFALSVGENSVHGSDSADNARIEIAQFFDEADIVG